MVVLVNGSPRGKMCTYRALEEVASALNANGIETEIVQASEDMAEIRKIADKIIASDGLVVGSPVYYASPTADSSREDFHGHAFQYRWGQYASQASFSCRFMQAWRGDCHIRCPQ